MFSRENTKLIAVAIVCLVGGSVVPATAAAIVANADKVDGFHAVGSGAGIDARKGKLVATSGSTGKLPNNIIKQAPDAAKFGGFTPAQLRFVSLTPADGIYDSGATGSIGGVEIPDTGGSWAVSVLVPPDHPSGSPVSLELQYSEQDLTAACSWRIQVLGTVSTVGETAEIRDWVINGTPGSGSVDVPSGSSTVFTETFPLQGNVEPMSAVAFAMSRVPDINDTCGTIKIRGALLRY